ncbi:MULTISPECIES: hypothetical protein [Streptomyces]|uniref:Uncharacterized protein n=2 Tax=Streptomyces TaxID=1883 RepID=A0ABX0YWX3_STRTL|nr:MULTISPECIES: hypothetical protein [Streptomyces]NJP17157.1 hypothetical protein [Streptomyces thermoviolaceus subsp. thermoviolaceus]RSS07046.1 hypothetical protein EF917_06230 [Streptomyces sp. WAC00469]WTD47444.1 hypothetical protein OG899_07880 [Streptomyces thermoviolaceus]
MPPTIRRSHTPGQGIPVETAWILVRLRKNPAEADYALARGRAVRSGTPGIHFDDWSSLPPREKERRSSWLRRHGRSPFQQLQISEQFLVLAGISVTDWGPPPTDGPSTTATQPRA